MHIINILISHRNRCDSFPSCDIRRYQRPKPPKNASHIRLRTHIIFWEIYYSTFFCKCQICLPKYRRVYLVFSPPQNLKTESLLTFLNTSSIIIFLIFYFSFSDNSYYTNQPFVFMYNVYIMNFL